MNHNFTRTTQPSPEEMAERIRFFEQFMREADAVNAAAMLAQSQQREHDFQTSLIEKTQLSVGQLFAIREWLAHNPAHPHPGTSQ